MSKANNRLYRLIAACTSNGATKALELGFTRSMRGSGKLGVTVICVAPGMFMVELRMTQRHDRGSGATRSRAAAALLKKSGGSVEETFAAVWRSDVGDAERNINRHHHHGWDEGNTA